MARLYQSALVVLAVVLAGCSTQPRTSATRCQVCTVSDGLTRGLVEIDPGLERSLLNQVPTGDRYGWYCWYQTPAGTLEAQPLLRVSEEGYEFERRDGNWILLRTLQYIDFGH